jgi:hypothetical protein
VEEKRGNFYPMKLRRPGVRDGNNISGSFFGSPPTEKDIEKDIEKDTSFIRQN